MDTNKRSTIKQVISNGTWESQYGMMYAYELHFESGDVANFSAKTADKFKEGEVLDYHHTGRNDRNGTPMAKVVFNQQLPIEQPKQNYLTPSDDRQKSIEMQMCYKLAIDYIKLTEDPGEFTEVAERLYMNLQASKLSVK
jgi:hypothetical protein